MKTKTIRLDSIIYERISWGWLAAAMYRGHLIRGRGCTKRGAWRALHTVAERWKDA